MRSILTLSTLAVTTALILASCKKEDPGTPNTGANPPTGAGGYSVDDAGAAARDLGNAAKTAFEDLKNRFTGEVADLETRLTDLKAKAPEFKDQELDGHLAAFGAKVTEARSELQNMIAAGSDASKDGLSRLISEARELLDKADARLNALDDGG